jgi:SWIM zinc finger
MASTIEFISTVLADVPFAKFKERQQTSRRYQVFKSKVGVYQVQIPDSGKKYTVELAENGCSCQNFWEYHSPCAHAIAACLFEAVDPYEHLSKVYTLKSYRRTYEVAMPPLSIENLPSDPNVLPPLIAKKRGRPREKRIRKGAFKRKQTRCTNCLQLGHNKRRYVAQPAQNRKAERARN